MLTWSSQVHIGPQPYRFLMHQWNSHEPLLKGTTKGVIRALLYFTFEAKERNLPLGAFSLTHKSD